MTELKNRSLGIWILCFIAFCGLYRPAGAFDEIEVGAIVNQEVDPSEYPGFPGIILAHQTLRETTGNSGGTYTEHFIAKIFDPVGAQPSLGTWHVDLDRNLQFVEVLHARVYRGSETINLESTRWGESAPPGLSDKDYPRRRRFSVSFPNIEAGDVLEAHVRIYTTMEETRYPTAWEVLPLAREFPVRERQIIITSPTAKDLFTMVLGWTGATVKTYKGATIIYDYHTGNLPALGSPEGAIDPLAGPPRFLYSNVESWEHTAFVIAREYEWASVRSSLGIEDSVRVWTKGKTSSRERLISLLNLIDARVKRAPLPTSLLRHWPRKAAENFATRCADPSDWVVLMRAMGAAVGLPMQVEMIHPRASWVTEDQKNPMQFTNIALKVRLPDEGSWVIIDPLRRPAGLTVSPFPGPFYGFAPIPQNPIVERGTPAEPDQTTFLLDLAWEKTDKTEAWSGKARIAGTGIGAAWIVQNLTNEHSEFDVQLPLGSGWDLILDPAPPLEFDWATSSAHSEEVHWNEIVKGDLLENPGRRLIALLPDWQDLLESGTSPALPPEGPMTFTTRMQVPSELLPDQTGGTSVTRRGSAACGSWMITLARDERSAGMIYQEVLIWNPGWEMTGTMTGLNAARLELLGG